MFIPPLFQRSTKVYKERRQPIDTYYKTQFRFDEASVAWMAEHFLGADSGERRGGALTNKNKFEICLRYMADPGFQNGVSEVVGVSQPTVSRTVKFVAEKICDQSQTWIRFPADGRGVNDSATSWFTKRKLPGCFGAVDGTLIKLQVPPQQYIPTNFYSGRKKVYCLNVMVICNSDEEFIAVCAKWPGRAHDAKVWRNSTVFNLLSTGYTGDKYLIADSAYPISRQLLKPYSSQEAAVDPVKQNFNNVLTKDRVLIENVIGQWKCRFQMLRVQLRLSLELVPKFILASAILHNVGKYLNDDFEPDPDFEDDDGGDDEDGQQLPGDGTSQAAVRRAGQAKRDAIALVV